LSDFFNGIFISGCRAYLKKMLAKITNTRNTKGSQNFTINNYGADADPGNNMAELGI